MATKRSMPRWCLVALVSAALVLSGCSALPEELDKAAESALASIEAARKANDKARADFPNLLKQPQFAFVAGYTREQQHVDRFDQAKTKLDEAKKVYDSKVDPHLSSYDEKKKSELEGSIASVNTLVNEAKALTADPANWLKKVAETKADPEGAVRSAATNVRNIQSVYNPLSGDVETARKSYERNAGVIDAKFKPLKEQHDRALQATGLLQVESRKSPPNFAVMAEHANTIENSAAAFKKDTPEFKAMLAELGVRETHTLIDIRVDPFIWISRTTWDDSVDSGEKDYDYAPVSVDLDTANYFAKFKGDDVLAVDGGGGFKTEKRIDRAQWDKLRIDPRQDWPKGHTNSEFYLGEIEDVYCHKLRVLKNGKPDSSGRPKTNDNHCSKYDAPDEVAQGIYWVTADDLDADAMGMDVYTKGFGDFADQASHEATPPGMVYVGDNTTGEWQNDNSGNSFWVFYGQYRFFSDLIGGPYPGHYRYEYDDWNRNYRYGGKPYYSTMNGQPRYGMKSPLASSRFPNSTYVRSGLYNLTVRGAGPAARAGGPGGGGK